MYVSIVSKVTLLAPSDRWCDSIDRFEKELDRNVSHQWSLDLVSSPIGIHINTTYYYSP
jgi:hypothetical protein